MVASGIVSAPIFVMRTIGIQNKTVMIEIYVMSILVSIVAIPVVKLCTGPVVMLVEHWIPEFFASIPWRFAIDAARNLRSTVFGA
jgi:hypothetical protein